VNNNEIRHYWLFFCFLFSFQAITIRESDGFLFRKDQGREFNSEAGTRGKEPDFSGPFLTARGKNRFHRRSYPQGKIAEKKGFKETGVRWNAPARSL
jgi:hypothetical protein